MGSCRLRSRNSAADSCAARTTVASGQYKVTLPRTVLQVIASPGRILALSGVGNGRSERARTTYARQTAGPARTNGV